MVGDWRMEHSAQPRTGSDVSLSRAPMPTGVRSGPQGRSVAGTGQVWREDESFEAL